jgi:hypothetical protein
MNDQLTANLSQKRPNFQPVIAIIRQSTGDNLNACNDPHESIDHGVPGKRSFMEIARAWGGAIVSSSPPLCKNIVVNWRPVAAQEKAGAAGSASGYSPARN